MTPPIAGHCLCGRTAYRAEAAPLWQIHCHCESCRRATASGFTSFFALYRSSPGVERRFCAQCGTQMAYRTASAPGEIHFYAATLENPELYRPTAHDQGAERLPWVVLCDGLPQI